MLVQKYFNFVSATNLNIIVAIMSVVNTQRLVVPSKNCSNVKGLYFLDLQPPRYFIDIEMLPAFRAFSSSQMLVLIFFVLFYVVTWCYFVCYFSACCHSSVRILLNISLHFLKLIFPLGHTLR
jgi:hypothetical protein